MILSAHNLRGHISRSSTGIIGVILPVLPRDTKISDSQISFRVQNKILRLDIPMNNFVFMHVFEPNDDISHKEFSLSLVKDSFVAEVVS